MRKVRNQKGFTIMELMIVIVIIGILIAIAAPAYQSFRQRASLSACNANMRTISSGIGMYFADHEEYPADEAAVAVLVDYIDNADAMVCPSGGTYTIATTSVTDGPCLPECSEHGVFNP